MATPTLQSVAPASGPPGTAITLTGTGFETGVQVACPSLVPTVRVSATQATAAIPLEITGPAGGTMVVSVYVQNPGGEVSGSLPFTIIFLARKLQTWTTIEAVCAFVPAFKRGGRIADTTIQNWMRNAAGAISGAMVRRGLSLNPADWPAAGESSAMPTPAAVLDRINALGAAVPLASAIAGEFTSGEWGLAKTLQRDYERELNALRNGDYDVLFSASAAVVESGPALEADGPGSEDEPAFKKDQTF